jgi:hypothetical protein
VLYKQGSGLPPKKTTQNIDREREREREREMAGEKGGQRSSIQEEKGKGKRSSVQEHRGGGEESPPKIRKVTQEEMGKRKGKLHLKEGDKPMELEKMRRLEGRGEKPFPKPPVTARMPEEKINFYRYMVQTDFEGKYFREENAHMWSGGLAQVRRINTTLRSLVNLAKEHSSQRLEEYKINGYLEYCPTEANLSHNSIEGR